MRSVVPALIAAMAMACPALSAGDDLRYNPTWPTGQPHPYDLDSGAVGNPGAASSVAFADLIHVDDAAFIRIYFEQATLEKESFVRITSLLDGEVQELDSSGVRMWNQSTAYFNGDTLLFELVAAPGTKDNHV